MLPAGNIVELTLFPFTDPHATLTAIFEIEVTKYIILQPLTLQTYSKTIETELSCLFLNNNIHITAPLKQIPFLQTSHKQPPF